MSYSGEFLVKLARKTIETYLKDKKKITIPNDAPKDLFDHSGVFVTLHRATERKDPELRGCIGRIESPHSTLIQSTIDSAIDAATRDPRFPPVIFEEMESITVETTILTVPEVLEVKDPSEYFNLIEIGKHGLIAQRGPYQRGLLLPQVPVEQNWDLEYYLNYVCLKAGLPSQAWTDLNTKISRFEGFIFSEETPNGVIVRKEIK
ncbi:MAG: TIGR00296 family protein [Candidatus Heimdallarchaeota archaeon]|nr:MAG: TIGR00296 family protein [Candidatus Heimdallarchaeota archaeon]